ncbi:retrovirus-related pol polyprotein from transposon TNT 1-94 [Tanacetum coccineum]
MTFDETPPPSKTSPLVDDDLDEEEAIKVTEKKNLENDIVDETLEINEIVNIKEFKNHPLENNVNEALTDNSWKVAMQEELNQFIPKDVWELVPQPRNMTIIETKWVFRNKLDGNVARLESIRILLAYACALDFKLFQMDVKSAFLNSFINEEVYVAQPPGFIDFEKPDHVYKLKKALYGLKQAPKACFHTKYALDIFKKQGIENCDSISTSMTTKPKLDANLSGIPIDQTKYHSMIESLMYLTASRPDVVLAMCFLARYQARPTEKHLKEVKRIFWYLQKTIYMGLWYLKDIGFELVAFLDVGYAGFLDTCNSTSGRIQFLGDKLVSWSSKKQDCTTMSTVEAEKQDRSISSRNDANVDNVDIKPVYDEEPMVERKRKKTTPLLIELWMKFYSTVDACKSAHEIWIAIKRLQQGESLNIQDVKTNFFWEFGKFTSRDGESMESYYSRFYKMMNEIICKSMFSFFNNFNQNGQASPYPDPYYQASKSHKSFTPQSKQSFLTRSNASTKFKGVAVIVRDFYKKFYNSLGSVPNRCSVV